MQQLLLAWLFLEGAQHLPSWRKFLNKDKKELSTFRGILFIVTIWDAPNLSSLAVTSKCTLLLPLVLSLWSQDLHQQKNFKNISSPLFPFLDRERGKRKIQDCSKLWKKMRGAPCGSFLLPEPASQMLSEGASIFSPDHPRALGIVWLLNRAAVTHPSSLHHHWLWPHLSWCSFSSLRPFLRLPEVVPYSWCAKQAGQGRGLESRFSMLGRAGSSLYNSIKWAWC